MHVCMILHLLNLLGSMSAIRVFGLRVPSSESTSSLYVAAKKKVVYVREFYPCPNGDQLPIRFTESKVDILGRGITVLNGVLDIPNTVPTMSEMRVRVEKCRGHKEACEFFMNVPLSKPCVILLQKEQVWSSVMEKFTPLIRCPLDQKKYLLQNASLIPDYFLSIIPGIEGFYWTLKVQVLRGRKLMMCQMLGGEITSIRSG